MVKEFLDKLGLEELIKLIVSLDSEGEAIKIEKKDHHKILSVKFDGETIKLNSEGELTLPLDFETIYLSSEGLLKAKPEELDDGIATEVYYNSEGHETVNVLLDGLTIILDSEGKLRTRIGGYVEKGGDIEACVNGAPTIPTDYQSNWTVTPEWTAIENKSSTIEIYLEGEMEIDTVGLVSFSDTVTLNNPGPRYMWDGTMNIGGDSFGVAILDDKLGADIFSLHNDSGHKILSSNLTCSTISGIGETISYVDNKFIKVDNNTIFVNSEGALEATFQRHTADKPIEIDSDGKITLNYDGSTLVLDSEGTLNVPIDGITIVIDSEGLISVNIDNDTIILDSEGRLCSGSVYPDNKTIVKDANKIISVPIDGDTIILSSEGLVVSPRGYINGVELKGDHNTEEAKITWWGSVAEYEALKAAGLLNEYTLYVIDTSEGYIPSTPNYNSLINKPQLNHVELSGDKKLSEFGIQPELIAGTSIDLANNVINLKYQPGVLTVDTSNRLVANTYNSDQINNMIGSMRTIKVVAVEPDPGDVAPNTLYYVKTTSPSIYDVILYDSDKSRIYLGTSQVGTYSSGTAIDIDTFNVISVKTDTVVNSEGTDTKVPTTKSVYSFLFQGASSTADGERGLVIKPVAGDDIKFLKGNGTWSEVDVLTGATSSTDGLKGLVPTPVAGKNISFLRGDATWSDIVDDCITDDSTRVLSAKQGKYLEDEIQTKLGTDIAWTSIPLTTEVESGAIWYRKKNNVVTISIEKIKLTSPLNLKVGDAPTDIVPERTMVCSTIALNNNNSQAAFTVDTAGNMKLYSSTGQYAYSGTLTYTV